MLDVLELRPTGFLQAVSWFLTVPHYQWNDAVSLRSLILSRKDVVSWMSWADPVFGQPQFLIVLKRGWVKASLSPPASWEDLGHRVSHSQWKAWRRKEGLGIVMRSLSLWWAIALFISTTWVLPWAYHLSWAWWGGDGSALRSDLCGTECLEFLWASDFLILKTLTPWAIAIVILLLGFPYFWLRNENVLRRKILMLEGSFFAAILLLSLGTAWDWAGQGGGFAHVFKQWTSKHHEIWVAATQPQTVNRALSSEALPKK